MDVGVIGIGHSKFGRRDDVTVQELAFEPFVEALNDAGIQREDIGATVIGASPVYMTQRSIAGPITEYLGLNPQPVWLTEAACSSSAAALRTAYAQIKAGMHDVVVVLGVQKMLELSTTEILKVMGRSGDVQWEAPYGTTFANYYALYANAHMNKHGTTPEQLADVAVKNHHYGTKNPLAMFQKEITQQKVLESRYIATPLHLLDCCANADGSAAIILTNEEKAKKLSDTPIWIKGMGAATAPFSILVRPDLTTLPSATLASKQAYDQAKITPQDLDVAEVHDCFTIAEIMAYEDLGFTGPGKGGEFVQEAYIGGKLPVNVDGGLKAKGHPIGATGCSQVYGVVKQLRGEAGSIQVDGAELGLTHNIGGHGQYCMVNIFSR
ncbi:MAG: thiolase domain-containing protein [Candidatus Kariarchaeaceae archaeon]|jgi:acetyl-CoA C-acetyltransferase